MGRRFGFGSLDRNLGNLDVIHHHLEDIVQVGVKRLTGEVLEIQIKLQFHLCWSQTDCIVCPPHPLHLPVHHLLGQQDLLVRDAAAGK